MKYLIPFIDQSKWEHNEHCQTCKQVDQLILTAFKKQVLISHDLTEENKQAIANNLQMIENIEQFLVDGYHIVQLYESNLQDTSSLVPMKNIESAVLERYHTFINGDPVTGSDNATVLFARWCETCGARKLDIYDTLRSERFDLLPITNFNIEVKSNPTRAVITWRDVNSDEFAYSTLSYNDTIVGTYTEQNQFANQPLVVPLEDNILYPFMVINYDRFNVELNRSAIRYVLYESDHKVDIQPVLDTKLEQEEVLIQNEHGRWIRKNALYTTYSSVYGNNNLIFRRSVNGLPTGLSFGLSCDVPYQVIEDDDLQTWFVKPFIMSSTYAKKTYNGFSFYQDVNINSSGASCKLVPISKQCLMKSVQVLSKKLAISWVDPYKNWSKTSIYIKEYDGKPITNKHEGTLIYDNYIANQYKVHPYQIENLKNGVKYQIGIFPVTLDGLVMVDAQQLTAMPLYIRDDLVVDEQFILEHEYVNTKILNQDRDLNLINGIDKFALEIPNKIYLDNFKWQEDKLVTTQSSTFWVEAQYPLVEGGIVSFSLYSNYPFTISIYNNHLNIFKKQIEYMSIFQWKEYKVELEKMNYCKIILKVDTKYTQAQIYLKDFVLKYKTGAEVND